MCVTYFQNCGEVLVGRTRETGREREREIKGVSKREKGRRRRNEKE